MAITHCRICHEDLTPYHASRGICPGCRNGAVREAVKLGYIDWQHTAYRMTEAMADRAVQLLNACGTVTDAYWRWHDAEDLKGQRYQTPIIYATITLGVGTVSVTIREDQILKILSDSLPKT